MCVPYNLRDQVILQKMASVMELESKIEDELRKPPADRNDDLLTFWKSRLPAPAPGNHLITPPIFIAILCLILVNLFCGIHYT